MNLVFLGAPGAGKGTQAERLTADRGMAYISTGQILRDAISAGAELGKEAQKYVESGSLVPDEVVVALVEEFLRQHVSDKGFLLDGFPRNIAQGEALAVSLDRVGRALDKVVYFDVDEETVIRRLSGRRTCAKCGKNWHLEFNPPPENGKCDVCGDEGEIIQREDDKPETIRERLSVYNEQTAALVEFYEVRGLLVRVDAGADVKEVYRRLLAALGAEGGDR